MGTIAGVTLQNRQLQALRVEQGRLLAQVESSGVRAEAVAQPALQSVNSTPSTELLRLRSQVNQLSARRQALENVVQENELLRAQLAARKTNTTKLPEGYIQRSTATMAGYNTPEAALQTFLWAIQSGDAANVFQTMTPKAAGEMQEAMEKEEGMKGMFMTQMKAVLGMKILKSNPMGDGGIQVEVEMMLHGNPKPDRERMVLRQVAGQWKIDHL